MITLPTLLLLAVAASALAQRSCKCTYGQSCWPREKTFNELRSRLTLPLIHPIPFASPCYGSANTDGPSCQDITSSARNGLFRADLAGALQYPNFATFQHENGTIEGCHQDFSLGVACGQGSIPPIGVDARSVRDVQEAVKFAAKHHLRLVVKNTGHDFLGRSAGRGAFMLWTHHLKNIVYNSTFRPKGAPKPESHDALTLGSGVQWREAYAAASNANRFIVGGLAANSSVGAAGGWIQGGGHSAFSPKYGLGVDNVLEFSIVLASGEHITVNAYNHQDLFWALRGGGGGTWGVLTSVTYRVHPIVPIAVARFAVGFTSSEAAQSAVTEYLKYSPKFADAGWGGYGQLDPELGLNIFFAAPNTTAAEASAILQPLIDRVPGAIPFTQDFSNFTAWYDFNFANYRSQVGVNVELASRFVHRDSLENDAPRVAEFLLSVPGGLEWNQVAGGAVSKVNPNNVAVHPAWRTAISHFYLASVWPDGTQSSEIQASRETLLSHLERFEALKPGAGTYYNEASLFEDDFQTTFFGSHYNRLKQIKKRYDAESLFVVASGVGSEEWNKELTCRI